MISGRKQMGLILSLVWGLMATAHADAGWYEEAPMQGRQDRKNNTRQLPQSRGQQPDIRTFSEALGHSIGKEMRDQGIELNAQDVLVGLEAGLAGKPPPVYEADYEEMIGHFRDRGFQEKSKANLVLANAFLKSNSRNEGVRELIPGTLQYKILKPGKGAVVQENGSPQIYYTGQLIDGTVFGTTDKTKTPVVVSLPDMIRGFQLGVAGMLEGEKRRIYIHPDLAYGVSKEVRDPNSILFFDVEVVNAGQILPKQVQETAQQQPLKSPTPNPIVYADPVDDWDLALDEDQEDDEFSTQPFQLQSVNKKQDSQ